MSSILQNQYAAVHGGPTRPQNTELQPKPPSPGLQSLPAATSPRNRPPRGRNAWASGVNDYLDGLRALPVVRPIPFIPGKELPLAKTLESARTQTRGAFLVATRGKVNEPPCDHCANGFGRFAQCISLDEWFHGACATCQMGTRGNHCSLRRGNDGLPSASKPRPKTPQVNQDAFSTESPQIRPSLKRKRKSMNEKRESAKEKRESLKDILSPDGIDSAYNSPYAAMELGIAHQGQVPSYSGYPPAFEPASRYPEDESGMLVNYIRKKPDARNGTTYRIDPIQPQGQPQGQPLAPTRPVGKRPMSGPRRHRTGESSPSLSPSAQLLEQTPAKEHRGPNEVAVPRTQPLDAATPSYVDKLPRKKQRQLFTIIGGIQSGIRSVRQQADSMQRQLDLLQAALGIDGEEADGES